MAEKAMIARLREMNPAVLKAGLAQRVNQVSSQSFAYLKFDGRSGVMNVNDGDKETRFPEGVKLAFNLLGSKQGFVCWKNAEVVEQYEKSFFETLPLIDTMTDHGPYEDDDKDGWQEQHQLFFKDLKTNTQYILRLVSKSGIRQVNNFIRTINENVAVHDFTVQTPIVTIEAAQFVAKGNKNYKPVFKIVEWVDTPKDEPVSSAVNTSAQVTKAPAAGANVKLAAGEIADDRD